MEYAWDEAKAATNLAKHGVAFSAVEGFDWPGALIVADRRLAYGEPRFRALGLIGDRLHVLVYTPRAEVIRMISLRRANNRERKGYEDAKKKHR